MRRFEFYVADVHGDRNVLWPLEQEGRPGGWFLGIIYT